MMAGQNRLLTWTKVAHVDKGRCGTLFHERSLRAPKVAAEPFFKKSWPGTAQSSVRAAAGGVVPDA